MIPNVQFAFDVQIPTIYPVLRLVLINYVTIFTDTLFKCPNVFAKKHHHSGSWPLQENVRLSSEKLQRAVKTKLTLFS